MTNFYAQFVANGKYFSRQEILGYQVIDLIDVLSGAPPDSCIFSPPDLESLLRFKFGPVTLYPARSAANFPEESNNDQ